MGGKLCKHRLRALAAERDHWLQRVRRCGTELAQAPRWVRRDFEIVLRATEQNPEALKFASDPLRDDADLLTASAVLASSPGGDDESHAAVAPANARVVMSRRRALGGVRSEYMERLLHGMQANAFLRELLASAFCNPVHLCKGFCGEDDTMLTSRYHPCRGVNCAMKLCREDGTPTSRSCWRYRFWWHQKIVKENNGFMLQVIELGEDGYPSLGEDQMLEENMAHAMKLHIIRVRQLDFSESAQGVWGETINEAASEVRDFVRGLGASVSVDAIGNISNHDELSHIMGVGEDCHQWNNIQADDLQPDLLTCEPGLLGRIGAQLLDRLGRGQPVDVCLRNANQLGHGLVTPKVLLTCLMSSLPSSESERLVEQTSALYPLPLVFRAPPDPQDERCFRLAVLPFMHKFHGIFLASISLGARGASSLLNALFNCNFAESSDSPLHAGSVDISLMPPEEDEARPQRSFHILDFHRGLASGSRLDSDVREEAESLVLPLLAFAQHFLLHVPGDMHLIRADLPPLLNKLVAQLRFSSHRKRVLLIIHGTDLTAEVDPDYFQAQLKELLPKEHHDVIATAILPREFDVSKPAALDSLRDRITQHFVGAVTYDTYWDVWDALAESGAISFLFEAEVDAINRARVRYRAVERAIDVAEKYPETVLHPQSLYEPYMLVQGKTVRDEDRQLGKDAVYGAVLLLIERVRADAWSLGHWRRQFGLRRSICTAEAERKRIDIEEPEQTPAEVQTKTIALSVERLLDCAMELHRCLKALPSLAQSAVPFTPCDIVGAFVSCMEIGYSMQLLDSEHKVATPEFLTDVFGRLAGGLAGSVHAKAVAVLGGTPSNRNAMISRFCGRNPGAVPGPTAHGVSASLHGTTFPDLPALLVVDVEIPSLPTVEGSQEAAIDQAAALAVGMGDVVLLNVDMGGSLSSSTQSLVRAVACHLDKMEKQQRPQLLFILWNLLAPDANEGMLDVALSGLHDQLSKSEEPATSDERWLRSLLNPKSVVLLPSADGSPEFGEACFSLRQLVAKHAMARPAATRAAAHTWCTRLKTVIRYPI